MNKSLGGILGTQFPHEGGVANSIRSAAKVGLIVAMFMLVYQPFGVGSLSGPFRLLKIAAYGLPCMLPALLLGLVRTWLVRHCHMAGKWKLWQELLLMLPMLMLVGLLNSLYTALLNHWHLSFDDFLQMQAYTLLVGVFPCALMLGVELLREGRANRSMAKDLNMVMDKQAEREPLKCPCPAAAELVLESGSESLGVSPERLCYVKAEGNYVELVQCAEGGRPLTSLLRLPLKEVESSLAAQGLKLARCHRSYLVNPARVLRAEGNAQGLTLHLDRACLTVPVSRSFVAGFRK